MWCLRRPRRWGHRIKDRPGPAAGNSGKRPDVRDEPDETKWPDRTINVKTGPDAKEAVVAADDGLCRPGRTPRASADRRPSAATKLLQLFWNRPLVPLPSSVTAATMTIAIRAASRAYSRELAPRAERRGAPGSSIDPSCEDRMARHADVDASRVATIRT